MTYSRLQSSPVESVWSLARRQHGVVARQQLLELGYSAGAIGHRLAKGRLHLKARGVYAVGRGDLTRNGDLMTAVLATGPDSSLSDGSAAELWGLRPRAHGLVEVSIPLDALRRSPGVRVHRRDGLEIGERVGIPVTSPARTLLDLATRLTASQLERAVNVADALDLIDPETLRRKVDGYARRPGVVALRTLLDRHTFRLTDSGLEQAFLAIVRRTFLPAPITRRHANGHRVDFLWPAVGLVIETDSLRYHRTASAQNRDTRRDHAHFAAGMAPLRFTHAQISYEPEYVRRMLERAHTVLVDRLGQS